MGCSGQSLAAVQRSKQLRLSSQAESAAMIGGMICSSEVGHGIAGKREPLQGALHSLRNSCIGTLVALTVTSCNVQGVENVYTQHTPLLLTTLEALVKGRLKDADFPYIDRAHSSATPAKIPKVCCRVACPPQCSLPMAATLHCGKMRRDKARADRVVPVMHPLRQCCCLPQGTS